jgi:hypothetical protein
MKVLTTFAAMQQIASTFLNSLQSIAMGAKTGTTNNDLGALASGADVKINQYKTGLATGATPIKLDGDIDWRDRIVIGLYLELGATANGLGGANEYNFSNFKPVLFMGYTGTGGLTAGGANPSAGNPPVLAAGKYRVQCDAANKVLLYANASDTALYLYNDTGATIFPAFVTIAFGDTGLH